MGIYIPGLDAPEKCNGCCMNLIGHCLVNEGLYVGRDNLEYNSKPDWCPAMNIQPHVRLIDANATLLEAIRISGPMTGDGWSNWGVYALIERQPTIIPADPEGGADG